MKKYEAVAEKIKKRIFDGTYQPRTLLPNQLELADEFNVSKITVKRALDYLESIGLLYKQSGLGTYVLGNISLMGENDSPVGAFQGLKSQLGDRVSSQVIKFEVTFPTKDLCRRLDIKETEPVYQITRLRLLDKQPFIIEHSYMPVRLVPSLSEDVLEQSIYKYIHQKLQIKFGGAFRKINADRADQYDIKYLGAKKDTPILEVEQIVWTSNGQNIEYSRSRNLYNKRSYTVVETNYD